MAECEEGIKATEAKEAGVQPNLEEKPILEEEPSIEAQPTGWEKLRTLGRGATAEVSVWEDSETKEKIAVKVSEASDLLLYCIETAPGADMR